MQLSGCSHARILKITGLSESELKLVRAEKRGLSEKQLEQIERAMDRTGGQLAAMTLPKSSLNDIFDILAQFKSHPRPKRSTAKHV